MIIERFISEWLRETFCDTFPDKDLGDVTAITAMPSTNEAFGDFQCNAAMSLARVLKNKPRDLAESVVQTAQKPSWLIGMEVAGPGFINLTVDNGWLAGHLQALAEDSRLGTPRVGQGKTVVLDYSSPNIAKPMHIGHIRSTVIGNALDRIHRFLDYHVISDNHLGDWGTQFGLLILGYRHFVNPAMLDRSPVEELERLYVESANKAKQDPAWRDQARAELVKLQQGDVENRALWEKFIALSQAEFQRMYKRLGVSFDLTRGESFYNDKLQGIVDALTEAGLAEISDGARVVFLDEEKKNVCMVQKSDGGFNYTTTDLATVRSRIEEFQPHALIYVTDERQQQHFRQFFEICRRMGWHTQLIHVWFGLMRLPEGTFSTRDGNVIKLEDLLDTAETKALAMVKEASPDMPKEVQREVARAVGLGAVKYADLSQNRQSLITFTWEKALALNGNSAPYLQYAHARINSVLDKYRERFPDLNYHDYPIVIADAVERRLALRLLRFAGAVVKAAELFRPNILADYLYELAQDYSTFYQNVPFLKAEQGVRESRLCLCELIARTLRQGLDLLGIEAPERI